MLTPRLLTIFSNVLQEKPMADIGTDHAYLPVELVRGQVVPRAIASDINTGPLERAQAHIVRAGLSEKIETRLGSGLTVLSPGEVSTIVIAGMGGYLITELIEASLDTAHAADRLVLQPMNNAEVLRHFLEDNGFKIIKEDLAREDRRIYEIIVACSGEMHFNREVDYLIGYEAQAVGHPLFKDMIERKIEMAMRVANHTRNGSTEAAREQHVRSMALIEMLKEVIHECKMQ